MRWNEVPLEVMRKVVKTIDGDGHGIFSPKLLEDAGVPQELVEQHTETFSSGNDHKSTIFGPHGPVAEMYGVYGLRVLEMIADEVCGFRSSRMGRGRRAHECTEAIYRYLGDATG